MAVKDRALFAREASYVMSAWLYLRGLGLVCLIAFISMWLQADALFLEDGILPAESTLDRLSERAVSRQWSYWDLFTIAPSVFWLGCSDLILNLACGAGCIASLLICLNLWTGPALLLSWMLYLSLVVVAQVFFSYQWDALLIESLFMALFIAPWGQSSRSWRWLPTTYQPSYLAWTLQRVLFFKLILLSGLVKLWSNDAPWYQLTALQYHYWTQPLPNSLSYWAHSLPEWFHQASCVLLFIIEVGTIWLVFFGPRFRKIAFKTQLFLQLAILLTGNYGFFNLLTMVLCISALDDRILPRWLQRETHLSSPSFPSGSRVQLHVPKLLRRVCLAMLIAMHIGTIVGQAPYMIPAVEPLLESSNALRPLRSLNSYGLFANMTEERPEIIFEGSYDGVRWKPYSFKWKPGALNELPGWATPHMPRLDWQMWFAALQGDCRRTPWILGFMEKILEGNPAVLSAMGESPFEAGPPRYLRTTLYQYRFTNELERTAYSNYWHRNLPTRYCPTVELVDGQLQQVGL